MDSWPFWVVVKRGQSVYDAIKDAEWYVSKIAAEATAEQLSFMNKDMYFVIGNDLEQQPLDVVEKPALNKKLPMVRKLDDMKTGETGYTVPWALGITKDGSAYLKLDYSVHERPGGTVQMMVQKLGNYWYQVSQPHDYEFSVYEPIEGSTFTFNLNII